MDIKITNKIKIWDSKVLVSNDHLRNNIGNKNCGMIFVRNNLGSTFREAKFLEKIGEQKLRREILGRKFLWEETLESKILGNEMFEM